MALFDFLGNPVGVGNMTWGQLASRSALPASPTPWMPPPQMGAQFMPQVPGATPMPGSPLAPMGGGGGNTMKDIGTVQDISKMLGGAGTGTAASTSAAAMANAADVGMMSGEAALGGAGAAGAAAPSLWSQIAEWLLALI